MEIMIVLLQLVLYELCIIHSHMMICMEPTPWSLWLTTERRLWS